MEFTRNLRFEFALGLMRAPAYPEAAVDLDEVQRGLNVHLHALAGSCQQKVVAGEDVRRGILPSGVSLKRHWEDLVWRDPEQAHLPKQVRRLVHE